MMFLIICLIIVLVLLPTLLRKSHENFAFTTYVESLAQDKIRAEMEKYKRMANDSEQDANCFIAGVLLSSYDENVATELQENCTARLAGTMKPADFIENITRIATHQSAISLKDWQSACNYLGDYAVQNGFSDNDFIMQNAALIGALAAAVALSHADDMFASEHQSDFNDSGGSDF